MERVTQTTAATAEESAAASEQLNAQAESSIAVLAKLDGWRLNFGAREAGRMRPATSAGGALSDLSRGPRSTPRPRLGPAVRLRPRSGSALPQEHF
jgi:hypothetical protein